MAVIFPLSRIICELRKKKKHYTGRRILLAACMWW